MTSLTQERLKESFQNHSTYEISKYLWLPLTLDGKKKWFERVTIAYIVVKKSKREKYYLKPILFLNQTNNPKTTMFNSKKIKQLTQQQELLDAKVNSLAYGQKSLSEDFEVHFKRLRQSIYTSFEEFSSELQSEIGELKKENEAIKKLIINVGDKPMRLGKIESNQKHQTILFATKIQILTDQIEDLKNQIAIPKSQLPFVSQIGVGGIGVPNWTMTKSTSHGTDSSPIQDKIKIEDIFEEKNLEKERKRRLRLQITPIDKRKKFGVNLNLPEKVLNYLHNRSSEKRLSNTCRNVFERGGKLVFAPLSNEITKNFVGSPKKAVTMYVSKNTYIVIHKIAKDLNMTMTQVANNFVATMDNVEATEIALKYSEFNAKDLQTKNSEKRGVGRPKKTETK
jgi:hypothetical protein